MLDRVGGYILRAAAAALVLGQLAACIESDGASDIFDLDASTGAPRDAGSSDAARAVDAGRPDGIDASVASRDGGPSGPIRVLVFSKTEGFRHGSIADGIAAVEELGRSRGWSVGATEDAGRFRDEDLADYDVVVWLNTTGDVLADAQQAAFERFIRAGGGYVGVHSAADTEYDWPWYGELMGAWFDNHPQIQDATVEVEDRNHPSTGHLDPTWARRDEWYNFRTSPRGTANVLLTLDEATYSGGTMGDHPIAWYREFDGGRTFYTGGGHTNETYSEPAFREHLAGGIEWAARTAR